MTPWTTARPDATTPNSKEKHVEATPMDRQQLLDRIRAGRADWDSALAQVDEQRMSDLALYDHWSVKDLIAHIGWWERRIVDVFRHVTEGTPLDPPLGEISENDINEKVYRQYQDAPLKDLRDMELSAYSDLLGIAESAPDGVLFAPRHFAWTNGAAFWGWLAANTYEHYAEHLPALRAWLDRSTAQTPG
jgi:hypothetical protein